MSFETLFILIAIVMIIGFGAFIFSCDKEEKRRDGAKSPFPVYLFERFKRSKKAFKMEVPRETESKLKGEFHCAKCGGKEADLETFSTPLGDPVSRIFNIDNTGWVKLSCEKCAFTQVYNYDLLVHNVPVWWDDTRIDGQYSCCICKNNHSKQIPVAFTGTGFSRENDWHGGEYKVHVCVGCAHADFYEVHRASDSSGGSRLVNELERLAREFQCKKCSWKGGYSSVLSAVAGPITRILNLQIIDLIAVNCEKCKFVDFYDRTLRAGENIFALR